MANSLKYVRFFFYIGFTLALVCFSINSYIELSSLEKISQISIGEKDAGMIIKSNSTKLIFYDENGKSLDFMKTLKNSFIEIFWFEIIITLFTAVLSGIELHSVRKQK